MRVLVTGAGGMVGRNLLAHAGAARYAVLAPRQGELDLSDQAATHAYLERERPEAIVHMAAVVGGIQANIDEPVRFLTTNTRMALNLFLSARELGISRILNLTSSCMYPRNVEEPLTTDRLLSAPLEPTNEGYALGKIISWKLLEYMVREDRSLAYKTILPCNLYGKFDHYVPRKAHLVPAAIMKVVDAHERGLGEIEIWGDGTARREFMFADDLADFIWWALPRLEELPSPLNVGLGRDWTVTEYYEQVAGLVGYQGRFVYDTSKPSGMTRKLLNVDQVNDLGWSAPTSLESGLRQSIEYYRRTKAQA
jgi:GDP-L-fucose synthase